MKVAENKTNKTINKAKQETTRATDKANVKMNDAKDMIGKALEKV